MRKIWVCDLKNWLPAFSFFILLSAVFEITAPQEMSKTGKKKKKSLKTTKVTTPRGLTKQLTTKLHKWVKNVVGNITKNAYRNPWIFVQGLPCMDEKTHNYLD